MSHIQTISAFLGAAAVTVAAGVYLFGRIRWLVRTIDALERLARKELTPNGGSSLKDDVANLVSTAKLAHSRIDALAESFDQHMNRQD